MVVAGLTGGIATGKSAVSSILREAGAIIIDADNIARDAVKKDLPAWHEIVRIFGKEVLLPDGEIDRARLGDIIFRDASKKEILNKIVHPHVIQKVAELIDKIGKESPDSIVILDVPLLIEAGMHEGLEDVILVYTPEWIQIERLIERDGITEEEALLRIHSQIPIEDKRKVASVMIDNSGTLQATREKAIEVFNRLKNKAG